jgi:anti-sigma B factor antagonist
MRTAVGVFADRDRAENAIRKLLLRRVPPERITFLTRSESEATGVGKHLQDGVDSPHGGQVPACFSVLAIPGVGPVLVQGPDVKDLFDQAISQNDPPAAAQSSNDRWRKTSATTAPEDDAAFFCRILRDGGSVIVVRSDSHAIASAACEVLDQLSLGIRKAHAAKSEVTVRQVPGAAIAHFSGKLALDEGCPLLRETVRAFLDSGHRRILLNLERVGFLDSAGLGELVRTHVAVRARGGQLTLINPSHNVRQLLRVTRVDQVFDIAHDELSALSRDHKTAH